MTEAEAFALVGFILVGYPQVPEWPEPTMQVWVDDLLHLGVGATEGEAAARQMFRSARFPSLADFHVALAKVREQAASLYGNGRPDYDRPALNPGQCHRCDGSGMVLMGQRIPDDRTDKGYRSVDMTHRCPCPAGARHQHLRLAPPEPPGRGEAAPDVAKARKEIAEWKERMRAKSAKGLGRDRAPLAVQEKTWHLRHRKWSKPDEDFFRSEPREAPPGGFQ